MRNQEGLLLAGDGQKWTVRLLPAGGEIRDAIGNSLTISLGSEEMYFPGQASHEVREISIELIEQFWMR